MHRIQCMTKKTRPSDFQIFLVNIRWTLAHRKFQYKSAIASTVVGIFLSIIALKTEQNVDYLAWIGGLLSLIGLIALWLDHREIVNEIKEFSIAPLTRNTFERVKELAEPYHYSSDIFENRTVLFPVEPNIFIRACGLDSKSVLLEEKQFEIPHEEYCRRAFEHFRRHARVVWNDDKVRLNTQPKDFQDLNQPIKLQKTSYFDYLATAFYSQRDWKYQNKVEYDGLSMMHDDNCLLPLNRTSTAHHIGISTLLLTSNKRILIQETRARGGVGRYVPSGSGSLDLKDIDATSFGRTLLNGALREFREETGWDDCVSPHGGIQSTLDMQHYPLGMALDISRGMVTDFYFLSVADKDTHLKYDKLYSTGKVVVDSFEMPTHNAITWVDCSECNTPDAWKLKLEYLINSYKTSDPILAINLRLFLELLEDIEESHDHSLWSVLLGNPNQVYTGQLS